MITMKLAGDALRRMERAAKIARASIMGAVRKAATRVQRQAKINVRQVLNTTGKSTGALSRSITTSEVPGKLAMAVGSGMIYARIHELGGVIKPQNAKHLAIPIGNLKGSPKQHKGLHLVVSRNSGLFLADSTGLQYVLKDSVTMPARPYLTPALDDARPWIENDLRAVADYILDDRSAAGGASE